MNKSRPVFLLLNKNEELMQKMVLLEGEKFQITIKRLCYQLIENHGDFADTVLIGIQPRGIFLAKRMVNELNQILERNIQVGNLDITFFRDDFRRNKGIRLPSSTKIDFIVESKKVILVDDVLWTGRTSRAALDALLAFGRPSVVEMVALVDRRYSRHLPIKADYIGIQIDTINSQKVIVHWKEIGLEDQVVLLSDE